MYQPYAWMVVNGYTDVDDRTWPCDYRGILAIHASKTFSQGYYDYCVHVLGVKLPPPEELERGGIVGTVNITGCLRPGEPTEVPAERRAHGGPNCYGFVFEDAKIIPFVPARGMPGLFEVDIQEALKVYQDSPKGRQASMF